MESIIKKLDEVHKENFKGWTNWCMFIGFQNHKNMTIENLI